MSINNNLIKQPARCCINCGKSYKLKSSLDKHMVLCNIIDYNNIKHNRNLDDVRCPSTIEMYKIIVELTTKYNKLENELVHLKKYMVKEKKKINILNWLNNTIIIDNPTENTFNKLITKITYNNINKLLNSHYNLILSDIIDNLLKLNISQLSIRSFTEKQGVIYGFVEENNTCIWIALSKVQITWFLNSIQKIISKELYSWKQANEKNIKESDQMALLYTKNMIKIMSQNYNEDNYYLKAKNIIYNKIKQNIKNLIEYELEF